jgi:tetratricopeptide (TPR) repeat protein
MWSEAPALGTGPGSWVAQRVEYTQAGEPDFYIPHAHNVYAQTLAEFGVAGLLAGVVVLLNVGWLLRNGLGDREASRRRMAWAALFVVAYFAAHHLFDFYPSMPAALFAFAVPIAWLDATAQRQAVAPPRVPVRMRAFGQVAMAGALIAALAFLFRSEAMAVRVNDAVIAANRGDWARARELAVPAVAGDADIPAYQLTLGLALAHTGELDLAAEALRRAAMADGLPDSWLNLAAVEAERERPDEATAALREALRLGVQRPGIALAAGDLALRIGEKSLAQDAFTEAIRRAPTLAGDAWWSRDESQASLFSAVVDAAMAAEPPTTGLVIALEAGRFDQATAIAGGLAEPGRAVYEDLIAAWQGDDAALGRLVARCEGEPVGGPVSQAALVLGHLHHPDAARLRDWADIINAGTDPRAYEVRVLEPADFGKAFSVASFYGHYTYRRPTPWDLLAPSLLHIGLE